MPTFETNSPAVIELARQGIADMVRRIKSHPDDYARVYGATMEITGHLGALVAHGLIDESMFIQLADERQAACKSVLPAVD